ncbi:MAG: deoxyribodipyrimidine photo-lyase [Marinifilaceae bacterium]
MRKERIRILNDYPPKHDGKCVLYWMQSSIRTFHNLALIYAIEEANRSKLPLLVVYRIDTQDSEISYRHFSFLVDGLMDIAEASTKHGFEYRILSGALDATICPLLDEAKEVVIDMGYLRAKREAVSWLMLAARVRVTQIEDNLIIPIETTSQKQEWSMNTIKPKLLEHLNYFLDDIHLEIPLLHVKTYNGIEQMVRNNAVVNDVTQIVKLKGESQAIDQRGGEKEAHALFQRFLMRTLPDYNQNYDNPASLAASRMSAYLHYGFISPLYLYYNILQSGEGEEFLENLLVKRELAHNYVYYNQYYDKFHTLPSWCRKTLEDHIFDIRKEHYSITDLEHAQTNDKFWNAAMSELLQTGYMHKTMRMYWGKKIIEWSTTPEEAFEILIMLNNRYAIDGNDANSYTGISWCFGLHDKPWGDRAITGKIRHISGIGLERKYNIEHYVNKWQSVVSNTSNCV